MSVYILGMEMPKGCAFCRIGKRNGKKMVCPLVDEEWDIHDPMSADHRLDNCPLIPVPPHGRLIDAGARVNVQIYNDEFEDYQTVNMSIDDLLDSSWIELEDDPTIIPAEEEKDGQQAAD